MSAGQQALLAQAGPAAPPGTAQQIDSHAAELNRPSENFIQRLMFWRTPAQPGDVVNAQQEAERLRHDSALGESPTVGATPITQSKSKGLLESLF